MISELVREPDVTEIDPAGAVLGRAFQDEPVFCEVISDPAERLALCTALFTANLRHARHCGGILVTGSSVNAVDGVLYWVDKPEPDISDERLRTFGYGPIFDRWSSHLEIIGQMERDAIQALGPLGMHWRYLAGVGVDPEFQGRGFGSRLIGRLIADANVTGMDCALVTDRERNVALYERFGFQTVATGNATEHGVRFWSMIARTNTKQMDGG